MISIFMTDQQNRLIGISKNAATLL